MTYSDMTPSLISGLGAAKKQSGKDVSHIIVTKFNQSKISEKAERLVKPTG